MSRKWEITLASLDSVGEISESESMFTNLLDVRWRLPKFEYTRCSASCLSAATTSRVKFWLVLPFRNVPIARYAFMGAPTCASNLIQTDDEIWLVIVFLLIDEGFLDKISSRFKNGRLTILCD